MGAETGNRCGGGRSSPPRRGTLRPGSPALPAVRGSAAGRGATWVQRRAPDRCCDLYPTCCVGIPVSLPCRSAPAAFAIVIVSHFRWDILGHPAMPPGFSGAAGSPDIAYDFVYYNYIARSMCHSVPSCSPPGLFLGGGSLYCSCRFRYCNSIAPDVHHSASSFPAAGIFRGGGLTGYSFRLRLL